MDKEYLTENDDGSVDIELKRGLEVDGSIVKVLRMREPTVADQIAASEVKGSEAEQEVRLIANLCEVSLDDVRGLTLRDYRRIQNAFLSMTE